MTDPYLHWEDAIVLYRKCECTVYALDGRVGWHRCGKCGVKPEAMPDYDDYVAVRAELAEARRHAMQLEEYVTKLQERINEGG